MVKILIDEKPDMVDVANDHGKTSLFLAAEVNGEFSKNFKRSILLVQNLV